MVNPVATRIPVSVILSLKPLTLHTCPVHSVMVKFGPRHQVSAWLSLSTELGHNRGGLASAWIEISSMRRVVVLMASTMRSGSWNPGKRTIRSHFFLPRLPNLVPDWFAVLSFDISSASFSTLVLLSPFFGGVSSLLVLASLTSRSSLLPLRPRPRLFCYSLIRGKAKIVYKIEIRIYLYHYWLSGTDLITVYRT